MLAAMVMVNEIESSSAAPVRESPSTTLYVMVKVPAALGVPLIRRVDGLKERLAGMPSVLESEPCRV